MDKYALLVRMNPKYWPAWKRHLRPGHESLVWFETGRRIPEEIRPSLPVIVLGTDGMGILATGESVTGAQFRADPDWAEASLSDQADSKEPRNRVQLRLRGLAVPIPAEDIETDSSVAPLPKRARETVTWLSSEEYGALMTLISTRND